jgi:hypothetical protein
MSANNPVFQVLVGQDDTAGVLLAGKPVTDLLTLPLGAFGVFDYETGLSVDNSTVVGKRNIFIATTIDTDADGLPDDIITSAATHIQRSGMTAYSLSCYEAEAPHIVDIYNFSNVNCETTYSFKVEFRGNSQAYQMFGFNQFSKTFSVTTGCCGPDCDCPTGDCNELAQLLVAAVNADTDGIIKAEFVDYTDPLVPVPVAVGDIQAWLDDVANAGKCIGVRLTSVPSKVYTYCQIPARYYKMIQFKMITSLLEPLNCGATSVTFQEPAFGNGQGKDIGWLEYEAGGYNGQPGPYRVGELAGIPLGSFRRLSTNSGQYNQLNLMYRNESVGGWEEYKNYLNTIIAVPCTANNVLLGDLIKILDAWLVDNYPGLTTPLADCDCGL